MMSKIKNIIIFVVIGLVFVFLYLFFIKDSKTDEPALVGTTSTPAVSATGTRNTSSDESEIARDFLVLLLNVKNITLNDNIFTDPSFTSLRDSSILLIPDGNEGRSNPFAPIGTDPVVAPSTNIQSQSTQNLLPVPVPQSSANTIQGFDDFDFGVDLNFDNSLSGAVDSLTN